MSYTRWEGPGETCPASSRSGLERTGADRSRRHQGSAGVLLPGWVLPWSLGHTTGWTSCTNDPLVSAPSEGKAEWSSIPHKWLSGLVPPLPPFICNRTWQRDSLRAAHRSKWVDRSG